MGNCKTTTGRKRVESKNGLGINSKTISPGPLLVTILVQSNPETTCITGKLHLSFSFAVDRQPRCLHLSEPRRQTLDLKKLLCSVADCGMLIPHDWVLAEGFNVFQILLWGNRTIYYRSLLW